MYNHFAPWISYPTLLQGQVLASWRHASTLQRVSGWSVKPATLGSTVFACLWSLARRYNLLSTSSVRFATNKLQVFILQLIKKFLWRMRVWALNSGTSNNTHEQIKNIESAQAPYNMNSFLKGLSIFYTNFVQSCRSHHLAAWNNQWFEVLQTRSCGVWFYLINLTMAILVSLLLMLVTGGTREERETRLQTHRC